MKNRIIVGLVVVAAVFLAGFLPQYLRVRRLENQLLQSRQENSLAQLRDLAGLTYLQASQRDYGLAAGTSTRFFDRVNEMANQQADPASRRPFQDILGSRDQITTGLAKGDPAILSDLQMLYLKTRQATTHATGSAD
ncbi:MAG TPA: hypothetical protein VG675_04065 [Bryobacteraceae bacterium]|nr:hypothetical protein [Bryobacteraceae bacterium]